MILKIKLTEPALPEIDVLPQKATSGSAGYDLVANISNECLIRPGEIKLIPSGICAEVENSRFAIFIYARSGLASKHGIALANGVGVIDSDYRGEIKCPMINLSSEEYTITPGMRIAQMVILGVEDPVIEVCDMLGVTTRSDGGFGSSGVI